VFDIIKNDSLNFRIEVKPEDSYCQQSVQLNSLPQVCFVLDKLDPDTTYNFQVQAFNQNVNKSSEFSNGTFAKTDAIPNGLF
jgi:hypothetical protein